MSKNRENVIWQSADGTWNRGFYNFYPVGDDEDYDSEWDVEYTDDFHWVSTGHATEEAAEASWRGVNPGGGDVAEYDPDWPEKTEEFDDLAARAFEQANKQIELDSGRITVSGPPKQRSERLAMRNLAQAFYATKKESMEAKVAGREYKKEASLASLGRELKAKLKESSPEAIKIANEEREGYLKQLGYALEKHDTWLAREKSPANWSWKSPDRKKEYWATKSRVELLREELVKEAKPFTVPKQVSKGKSDGASSVKYHVTPTGQGRKCSATVKACPYGGADVHFASKESAQKAYEKSRGGSF